MKYLSITSDKFSLGAKALARPAVHERNHCGQRFLALGIASHKAPRFHFAKQNASNLFSDGHATPCPAVESMPVYDWGSGDWEPSRSMHKRQLQCDTVSFNAAMKVLGDWAKQLPL